MSMREPADNQTGPRILHISADYPNPHRNRTTTAIERLVRRAAGAEGNAQIGEHIVMSLNRTSKPWKTHFIDCGERHGVRVYSYRYFGLPMGLGLARTMRRVARKIASTLSAENWKPNLIHAHKFAFEGIAGLWLAEHYGDDVRLFVSVRGESERNVLLFKPDYRPLMRRIAAHADMLYHVSAWFRPAFHEHIPEQPEKERLLPNIVGNTSAAIPSLPANGRFATVLHLNLRKRKGLNDLLKGFALFLETNPGICLDIIGPGDDETVAAVTKEIDELDLAASVKLLGGMDGKTLFSHLPNYLALALPSHQETFGMVYLEALFAGIPILYSQNTGIDGYLDGMDAGVGIEAGNVQDIASALETLYLKNEAYRQSIAASGQLLHDRFNPDAIAEGYRADIERFCCQTNSMETAK